MFFYSPVLFNYQLHTYLARVHKHDYGRILPDDHLVEKANN